MAASIGGNLLASWGVAQYERDGCDDRHAGAGATTKFLADVELVAISTTGESACCGWPGEWGLQDRGFPPAR